MPLQVKVVVDKDASSRRDDGVEIVACLFAHAWVALALALVFELGMSLIVLRPTATIANRARSVPLQLLPFPPAIVATMGHTNAAAFVYPPAHIAPLTVVVNGIRIFSWSFVLRQFMLDCIDWLAALVVSTATPILCVPASTAALCGM